MARWSLRPLATPPKARPAPDDLPEGMGWSQPVTPGISWSSASSPPPPPTGSQGRGVGWGQVGVPGATQQSRAAVWGAASRLCTHWAARSCAVAGGVGGRQARCRQTPTPTPNTSRPPDRKGSKGPGRAGRGVGEPWGLQPRHLGPRPALAGGTSARFKDAGKRKGGKSCARPGSGEALCVGMEPVLPGSPFPTAERTVPDAHCPPRPPATSPWTWEVASRGRAASQGPGRRCRDSQGPLSRGPAGCGHGGTAC